MTVVLFPPGYGLLHHLEASEAAVCEVSLTAFRSLDGEVCRHATCSSDAWQVDGSDISKIIILL